MDQRQYLTSPDNDANIMLWHEECEAQMGEQMQANGDFQCMVEEAGEFALAWSDNDKEGVADALCDYYVAAFVMERLIRREHGEVTVSSVVVDWCDDPVSIFLQVNGIVANYLRKPKDDMKTEAVLSYLRAGRLAARRTAAYAGLDWDDEMSKVLWGLDKRLREGYKMNADGSAIKSTDW